MKRRHFLSLSSGCLLPLACKPQSPATAPETTLPIGKKGLCLSAKNRPPHEVSDYLEATASHWIYNWNTAPPEILPARVAYTPMIYQVGKRLDEQVSRVKREKDRHAYRELLGFNEPDAETQGNTTVEAALNAWPMLEATGLRLGSPATVHPDNEWMLAFMKGIEQRGLRVDFICMHSYGGPGVDSLIRKIEKVHELYRRPVWITEFAVADWNAKTPDQNRFQPEKVAEFVSALLPRLEAMDIVERYAWFTGGVSGGPLSCSQLFDEDGSLSVVGEAYRAAGA